VTAVARRYEACPAICGTPMIESYPDQDTIQQSCDHVRNPLVPYLFTPTNYHHGQQQFCCRLPSIFILFLEERNRTYYYGGYEKRMPSAGKASLKGLSMAVLLGRSVQSCNPTPSSHEGFKPHHSPRTVVPPSLQVSTENTNMKYRRYIFKVCVSRSKELNLPQKPFLTEHVLDHLGL
jgi:hypothetical protein